MESGEDCLEIGPIPRLQERLLGAVPAVLADLVGIDWPEIFLELSLSRALCANFGMG